MRRVLLEIPTRFDAEGDTPLREQRYGEANLELDTALKARGAQVLEIPTYRWSLPSDTVPLVDLMDALDRHEIDAAVFTNAAQVHNL